MYLLWLRLQPPTYLVRSLSEETPNLKYLGLTHAAREALASSGSLYRIAQHMRGRIETQIQDLDAIRTIEATLLNGGLPRYVYRKRLVFPEYLVLIDKRNPGDHHSCFVDEILKYLEASNVAITRYYFSRDPRTCFAGALFGEPDTLMHIAQIHSQKRLLVFWDGAFLIEPASGSLQDWKGLFEAWDDRALFVPSAESQPSRRREMFSKVFSVYSSSLAGLGSYSGSSSHGILDDAELERRAIVQRLVSIAPERWLSRTAPEQSSIDGLVKNLQRGLGKQGFFWICACAVYPELRFELTVFLGQSLPGYATKPLLDSERFALLSSLPWFRNNFMPDWLRIRLIGELSSKEKTKVRGSIGKLLLMALRKRGTDFELEVAEADREAAEALFKRLLRTHLKKGHGSSPLRDYVFVTTWKGWRNPLALLLPSAFRDLWKKRSTGRRLSRDIRCGLSIMISIQIMFTWSAVAIDGFVRAWVAPVVPTTLSAIWFLLGILGVSIALQGRSVATRGFGVLSAILPVGKILGRSGMEIPDSWSQLTLIGGMLVTLIGLGLVHFLMGWLDTSLPSSSQNNQFQSLGPYSARD